MSGKASYRLTPFMKSRHVFKVTNQNKAWEDPGSHQVFAVRGQGMEVLENIIDTDAHAKGTMKSFFEPCGPEAFSGAKGAIYTKRFGETPSGLAIAYPNHRVSVYGSDPKSMAIAKDAAQDLFHSSR